MHNLLQCTVCLRSSYLEPGTKVGRVKGTKEAFFPVPLASAESLSAINDLVHHFIELRTMYCTSV